MSCRCRFTILLVLAGIVIAGPPASAKELEDRDWIEVRTANFQIRSVLGEKDSIELARYLEMFRVMVSLVTNISRVDSPIPTEIYVLRRRSDYETLGGNEGTAGGFKPGLRSNTILIRDTRGMEETSIIMHEYVHFLARNHGSLHYPRWFDEGYAEYLAAARIRSGIFEIGGVPEHRLGSLTRTRWITLEEIISPEDYSNWSKQRRSMFYAESWALVHFLQNRRDQEASFSQQMTQYIMLLESGKDDLDAFEEAFTIELDGLDKEVKRYLSGRGIPGMRLTIDNLLPDFNPEVITLTREQSSLGLGKIALRNRELEAAEHWFTIAATDELTRPGAQAGLGDVLKFQDEFEAALPYFENAVALAPNDPLVQLDIAEYWPGLTTIADRQRSHGKFSK